MISLKGDVLHYYLNYYCLIKNYTLPVSQGVGRPKINTFKLLKLQSNLGVMLPFNSLTSFLSILSAQSSVSLCIYKKS